MAYIIAIAGKGGTGKTTVAALLVRLLKEEDKGSVLAVDADPNSNLGEVLGVEVKQTIGSILDDIGNRPESVPAGMSKDRFIEYQVQSAVYEAEGFDVLSMGKPEGPGCYCYVNNVLRNVVSKLIQDYDYIVIDNEAGLEHLSRRTTRSADTLLVVSNATPIGLRAARRVAGLAKELKIETKRNILLVNRCAKDVDNDKIRDIGLQYIGNLPEDELIEAASLDGDSIFKVGSESIALGVLCKLGEKIWQK